MVGTSLSSCTITGVSILAGSDPQHGTETDDSYQLININPSINESVKQSIN